jgi:CubicO group peptidase (beta-lactamase class C family)
VLGWDTVSPYGYTSAGRGLSGRSRGHLGFSGTSLWIDPERAVAVVLLTNRTHPDRTHTAIRAFRPCLHDAVARDLGPLPQSPTSSKGQRRD